MGRRNKKHEAPMRGDGLCPHGRDDWRDRRFWKRVEVAILWRVMLLLPLAFVVGWVRMLSVFCVED